MRISDNNLNLYTLSPQQDKSRPSVEVHAKQTSAATSTTAVDPIPLVQKQMLLKNYLQQPVEQLANASYSQKKALEAYFQQENQGKREQIHTLLGVDEYV